MRRFLRAFAIGLLVGGLVGLWLGINIGRDEPLFSNPLSGVELSASSETATAAREFG